MAIKQRIIEADQRLRKYFGGPGIAVMLCALLFVIVFSVLAKSFSLYIALGFAILVLAVLFAIKQVRKRRSHGESS